VLLNKEKSLREANRQNLLSLFFLTHFSFLLLMAKAKSVEDDIKDKEWVEVQKKVSFVSIGLRTLAPF
jgi:hypothetical protein